MYEPATDPVRIAYLARLLESHARFESRFGVPTTGDPDEDTDPDEVDGEAGAEQDQADDTEDDDPTN